MLPVPGKFFLISRPPLRTMRSSFALYCLCRESVIINTSSCCWPRIFNFILFKTRSTFCSTRICAFALIELMENDVVFPSIFVIFFTLVFKEGGSTFATHCPAFCRDCSFRLRVSYSDSSLLSACLKNNCSSTATTVEDVVTSIGFVWIFSRILRRIFSVTLSSSLERKSAEVFSEPALCTILKLIFST